MDRSFLLPLGFGTTVLAWVVGYICRMPPAWVPGWLLLLLFLACLFLGGYASGRHTGRGWTAGAETGALSSVLNMLVLGSLLGGAEANHVAPSALWWVPGSILIGTILGGTGGKAGSILRSRESGQVSAIDPATAPATASVDWTAAFAVVAAIATFSLLVVGGIVTGKAAGLAVVDWPNSFGYSMFLYPLSRMTGGIFYEHAHRLFGSLVGLTTLVLAVHLFRVGKRRWVLWFTAGTVLFVILQGVLGGLRVTGHLTFSASPEETRPSLLLAVVHGVTGQLFFAMMVALAAFVSPAWKGGAPPIRRPSVSADQTLSLVLVAALLIQITLGSILRHESRGLPFHIAMGVCVLVLAVASGARAARVAEGPPVLRRIGVTLLWGSGLQVLLGLLSLVVVKLAAGAEPPPGYKVAVTTAHQAMGAVLLSTAVLHLAWGRRLLAR